MLKNAFAAIGNLFVGIISGFWTLFSGVVSVVSAITMLCLFVIGVCLYFRALRGYMAMESKDLFHALVPRFLTDDKDEETDKKEWRKQMLKKAVLWLFTASMFILPILAARIAVHAVSVGISKLLTFATQPAEEKDS